MIIKLPINSMAEGTKAMRAQFGTRLMDFDILRGEPDLISDIKDMWLRLALSWFTPFFLLSARHVVRAALSTFPRPLMRFPAFPALCDALHSLFRLNAALRHSLGLGITPQQVTIKPHSVL